MGSYHILVEGLRWLPRVVLGAQPLRLHITVRCLGGDLYNVGVGRWARPERATVGRGVLHGVLIPQVLVTSLGVEVIRGENVKLAGGFNWIYWVFLIGWARLCVAGHEVELPTLAS